MIGIKQILCPTDLSSESDEALRYAVALASAYKAKLSLLYCRGFSSDDDENSGRVAPVESIPLFTESLGPHLGLTNLCDLNWEGLVVQNVANIGNAIVTEAANRHVDLIVMRSRKRPHAALILGSTAETVCRTAPCPVLVTHPREREWVGLSTGEIDLHRVLVAHDFSPDAELALNYGLSLSQEYQTELHVLHILSEAEVGEPEIAWIQNLESAYTSAARKLQSAIPKEAFLWCKIVTEVRWGKSYQEVLAYAKTHEIDLICLGSSSMGFNLGALLGSNVDRILRQATCPVLIARPVKFADRDTLTQLAHHAGSQL